MTFDFHDLAMAGSFALIASLWILPLAALLAFAFTAAFHKASKNALYITCTGVLFVSVLFVFGVFFDALHKQVFDVPQTVGSSLEADTPTFSTESAVLWNFNPILVIGLWGTGVAIGIMRFACDLFLLRTCLDKAYHVSSQEEALLEDLRRCQALNEGIKILKSDDATSPFACFAFKPVIFVPANFFDVLDGKQSKSILRHEMAHIARGDLIILYLERFLTCLFYFNPAFFSLRSLTNSLREASADDLSADTEDDRKSLAFALARLAKANIPQTKASLALSSGYYDVSDRVAFLLRIELSKAMKQRKRIRHLLLISLLTLFGGVGYAVAHTGAPIDPGAVSSFEGIEASTQSAAESLLDEADLLFARAEAAYATGQSATAERLYSQAERLKVRANNSQTD